jgi:hypothetical protein
MSPEVLAVWQALLTAVVGAVVIAIQAQGRGIAARQKQREEQRNQELLEKGSDLEDRKLLRNQFEAMQDDVVAMRNERETIIKPLLGQVGALIELFNAESVKHNKTLEKALGELQDPGPRFAAPFAAFKADMVQAVKVNSETVGHNLLVELKSGQKEILNAIEKMDSNISGQVSRLLSDLKAYTATVQPAQVIMQSDTNKKEG